MYKINIIFHYLFILVIFQLSVSGRGSKSQGQCIFYHKMKYIYNRKVSFELNRVCRRFRPCQFAPTDAGHALQFAKVL